MYHIMYDPSGAMFEVTARRVKPLLEADWTFSYPEDLTTVFVSDLDRDVELLNEFDADDESDSNENSETV